MADTQHRPGTATRNAGPGTDPDTRLGAGAAPPGAYPADSLMTALAAELARGLPFSLMAAAHVQQFVAAAVQTYHAPGEVMLEPASGPVQHLRWLRRGSITGRKGLAEVEGHFELVAGDLFPVGAVLGQRAVSVTYTANEDTFCLAVPAPEVQRLAATSPPFADFLNQRVLQYLELSRRAVQAAWATQTLAAHSLDARLSTLPAREPLTCHRGTPLAEALALMHERRVGSVLVLAADGQPEGILTRYDILGRVTLAQLPLHTPVGDVMSAPIHVLSSDETLQDAALLMSRHGIRHVPVTENGRVVNVVSERDLFALQRLSLKQLSTQIRAAADDDALRHLAGQVREFARNLLGQGVQARQITELVSHLNDVLTERLVRLVAGRRGMDLGRACWLAFGSEGRGEQTVATDQDNGLVFDSAEPEADRPRWLAFALEVNEALDACGYPLCKGQVMASNPECCLTAAEWRRRFAHWVDHGAPEDLLKASIYFDLRPLCGNSALAADLQTLPARAAAAVPRFLKQMADNALRNSVPLNWRGALHTRDEGGHAWLDLKLHGTSIFVDAARLFALAQGLPVVGTRARLLAAAPGLRVSAQEAQAWVVAFDFLQLLRLQVQIGRGAAPATAGVSPNDVDVAGLNDIDRRMLKESLRVARRLQQRMQLDYAR
jgi:CBS domain-containing protein